MKNKLLRILIIEDNIDHVELLSQAIERHFASVDLHTVESIDDAIDFIEQTEYDIILTDCYIDNKPITNQIPHLRSKIGNTPIIVITGSGDEALAADVIRKGGTDYLVKTRESLETIPLIIKKYTQKGGSAHKAITKDTLPLRDKIAHEVATLGRRAKRLTDAHGSRVPDIKQLESLLDQIQRLKDLASKMMDK